MMTHTNDILGICLAVILCICSTHEESFLTWNITDANVGSTEIYFTQDTFTKFYNCLCNQFSRQCLVYIDVANSVKGDIQSVAAQSKFQSNRYECLPEIQIVTSSRPLSCTRVIPIDNNKYSLSQYCTRYSVNENLLNITCDLDLASVEISSTSNILISPTLNGDGVNINSSVECSVNTLEPTMYGTSTIGLEQRTTFENLSLSNTSLSTSSRSSSSSSIGLTKEHIIIMCLAVGIVIIISALIILGIVLWRRLQNSRNNILSKVPTIHKTQDENDNGIVNQGGDFSFANEITDPYTSKSPKASEFEASNLKDAYTIIDADMANVKFTKAAVKSSNESLKLEESTRQQVSSGSENPYAEPEVITDVHPVVDSDKTVGKITNLSKNLKNVNSPKPADTNSKGARSVSRDLHSKPETDNVTETYAVVKPSTKLNRGRSTNAASPPNKSDNEDLDILTDAVSVLYHAPSSKYGNSNLNVNSSPDSGSVLTKNVDNGLPGSSKLYYASTDIVNSDFNSDQAKPQDTHEYFILEPNYESSDCSESEEV